MRFTDPPPGQTPAEAHRAKMERKKDFNAARHEHRKDYLKRTGNNRVIASLSKWHPDYGMTVAQHEEQKALRAAGKVKFVPKSELRQRRGALGRAYGL